MLARPGRGATGPHCCPWILGFATVIMWLGSLRSDMMKTLGKTGSVELSGEGGQGRGVRGWDWKSQMRGKVCLISRNCVRAAAGLPNLRGNKRAMPGNSGEARHGAGKLINLPTL